MRQRFKFADVNEITGAFVLLVVLVVMGIMVWMAYSQRWFRPTIPLEIVLPDEGAAGIRRGSDVHFLGTHVGTVSDVVLTANGRMVARTRVPIDFFRFLRRGSLAAVKKKMLVTGDAYFDIARGEGPALSRRNAAISCQPLPANFDTTVEEVRGALVPVLEKLSAGVDTWTMLGTKLSAGAETWTALGTGLGESRQQLSQLVARLDGLIAQVAQGQGTAGKLLTDPAVADDLKTALDKGNVSLDQVQAILKDAQIAGAHLATVSAALAQEARDLPGLVAQAQQTLYEMERLIAGIEKVWPIRSHIEQRRPDTRIPPSEVVP